MFASNPTNKSSVNINAVGSVIFYSGFIFTTLCLCAIILGVDIREAVSSFPVVEPTIQTQNYNP